MEEFYNGQSERRGEENSAAETVDPVIIIKCSAERRSTGGLTDTTGSATVSTAHLGARLGEVPYVRIH